MLPEYTRKSNKYVAIGLCLQGAAIGIILARRHAFMELAGILALAGTCLMIYGCGMYMQAKGYSRAWSCLGLLGLLGLIVMFCFPDRHKAASEILPRHQGRAFLWGGCAGVMVVALPLLLFLFFGDHDSRNDPHGGELIFAIALLVGVCFVVSGLVGLVIQSVIHMLKPAPKATCQTQTAGQS